MTFSAHVLARLLLASAALVLAAPEPALSHASLTELERELCSTLGPETIVTASDRECAAIRAVQKKAEDTRDAADQKIRQRRIDREATDRQTVQARRDSADRESRTAADQERLARIDASTLSDTQKDDLRTKTLAPGATAEMARVSWGEPQRIVQTPSVAGNRVRWSYPNGGFLYFADGIITAVVKPR